ncbi:MAG: hypothetical protein F6K00_07650 [Leptolyngbya sp. SIOISBB]|nr:hypothetical protein [Leptolyngbya sp. SIOISBB]
MKVVVFGFLPVAIAMTLTTAFGGAIAPDTSTQQLDAAELMSRHYIYRGTGRRQILS